MVIIPINARGSLTLPEPLRKKFGLEKGGFVIANASGKGIFLKPANAPIEMYSESRVAEFNKADSVLKKHLAKRGIL